MKLLLIILASIITSITVIFIYSAFVLAKENDEVYRKKS